MPKSLWALTGVAVLAVVAYGAVLLGAPIPFVPASHVGDQIVCTADAMRCPDGSWVGRSGPNCEFVCPTSTSTNTGPSVVSTHIGETVMGALGVKITPLKILEDSRCPVDVQCIQAGTVRLQAQVVDGMGTSTVTFILGKPITLEASAVVLIDVQPTKHSQVTLQPSDYTFTFSIDIHSGKD